MLFSDPAALLRLRGSTDKVFAELEEMKEEAAHTLTGVTIHEFFKKRRYRQPIIIVLIINLGSQLSGFNAVSLMKYRSVYSINYLGFSLSPIQILGFWILCVRTIPLFLKKKLRKMSR